MRLSQALLMIASCWATALYAQAPLGPRVALLFVDSTDAGVRSTFRSALSRLGDVTTVSLEESADYVLRIALQYQGSQTIGYITVLEPLTRSALIAALGATSAYPKIGMPQLQSIADSTFSQLSHFSQFAVSHAGYFIAYQSATQFTAIDHLIAQFNTACLERLRMLRHALTLQPPAQGELIIQVGKRRWDC